MDERFPLGGLRRVERLLTKHGQGWLLAGRRPVFVVPVRLFVRVDGDEMTAYGVAQTRVCEKRNQRQKQQRPVRARLSDGRGRDMYVLPRNTARAIQPGLPSSAWPFAGRSKRPSRY